MSFGFLIAIVGYSFVYFYTLSKPSRPPKCFAIINLPIALLVVINHGLVICLRQNTTAAI